MNLGDVLQALADSGATPAQLVAAVRAEEAARARAAEAALVERRAKSAERQRRKRERDAAKGGREPELPFAEAVGHPPRHAESRGVTPVTGDSPSLSPSPTPPSTNPSPDPPYSPPLGDATAGETREPDLFAAAWSAYPHVPGRSSRPKARLEWAKLDPGAQAALPAAAARYRAEGREPRMDGGAKRFELWLKDRRFLDWTPAAPLSARPGATWTGPADLRAAVVAAAGEGFAKAYLDPSGWREGEILPRTATAADRLKRDLRKLLSARGVTVGGPT